MKTLDIYPLLSLNNMGKPIAAAGNTDTVSAVSSLAAALDNPDIIDKLRSIISVSIELLSDYKAANDRCDKLDEAYNFLLKQNNELAKSLDDTKNKINQLEQGQRSRNLIISGVKETYAERTDEGQANGTPLIAPREDTMRTTCSVIQEACGIAIGPEEILTTYRLNTKSSGPRPILVSFHSSATRSAIIKARRPRQVLSFRGSSVYFNDDLTPVNALLFKQARQLVKDKQAFSAWTSDGQPMIKWMENTCPKRISTAADLMPK